MSEEKAKGVGRGGVRKGAGRKPSGMQMVHLLLPPEQIAFCKAAGVGTISFGIRKVIDEAMAAKREKREAAAARRLAKAEAAEVLYQATEVTCTLRLDNEARDGAG